MLTLPRTAIVYSLYGDSVFVVEPAPAAAVGAIRRRSGTATAQRRLLRREAVSIVERRFVKLGATRGERIAIVEGVRRASGW